MIKDNDKINLTLRELEDVIKKSLENYYNEPIKGKYGNITFTIIEHIKDKIALKE